MIEDVKSACRELVEMILAEDITSSDELNNAKKAVVQRYNLSKIPKNSDILAVSTDDEQGLVRRLAQIKPIRTISGVAVIAVMSSPHKCPHGSCVPCPGGPTSSFRSPQSYTGYEPAALRAIQQDYDPYRQATARLTQLKQIGHPLDKAELIVMGGTFTARSLRYQEWFVRRCLEAMNDFANENKNKNKRKASIPLKEVQKANENAGVRNVGITFETRPDWSKKEHIDLMLKLGGTKVELGIQSTHDFVLRRIQRGHTVEDAILANALLRDSGLKVGFHMMPGLPGSSLDDDLKMFRRVFTDSEFKPDYLKIYPTLIVNGTRLHDMWKNGEYVPLTNEDAVELLAEVKSFLPRWVRLQRIQRDIPVQHILAGVTKSNIRQLAADRLRQSGKKCQCIRCREVGHALLKGTEPDVENITSLTERYDACGGVEHFISIEDVKKDILIGFLRLRFPDNPHRPELSHAALVRELHVYGPMVPIGSRKDGWQHRGYGKELLSEAENITKDNGFDKIAITSGVGVRDYYRKLGYELDGPYMVKGLR
ncbi:MAG: tRNA uridine(34) 5-carboxymethylaminomethyl modification radical SAM/GNAT enzyme Elp3 [Methanocellales archaeon]|nr:tRNA uridine(34) 5-carboxymethylaminomethyl modification radical SAM/GNAT enzyme Elp3 [Methanocellales archaeon]MDD3291417.1 tRNA uridine(34) 5-carboxymethylaminomethyl modification radical SAM/GNAT enzyme Elp3 [Methanocellales archaeon]MDD5234693.1 tRNA uridine(34) 5-carboxymethylaminomethyl modification radical SAM/GNAT enzyme Elp3 [Methanocellales archaeon]MDD5484956.1 tRNA uridine(34) 5-carboxymethylaminomethyl modification radical SAM/GNAT enzyme Elp3 [Methanocellales archaeon]